MKNIFYTVAILLIFIPVFVFAQQGAPQPNFEYAGRFGFGLIDIIRGILIPLVLAFAVLMFLWGVVKAFILGGADDREEGRKYMLWAVVAFVVMVSLWGIVRIVGDMFGVDNPSANVPIQSPGLPTPNG